VVQDGAVTSEGGTRSRRSAVAILALLAWSAAACSSNLGEVDLTVPDQTDSASSEGSVSSTDGLSASSSVQQAETSTTQLVTTTAVPDCLGLADVSSGEHTFVFDGVERRYRLALPTGYDGTQAAAMVVNFHGFGGSADKHDENTSMSKIATHRGFVVVTPQANNDPASWNARSNDDLDDDYGFIHSLVVELLTKVCVDPQRVYAAGFANGAVFAGYLVCSAPSEFAAVAMVGGTTLWLCPPEVQPSVLAIAGTADESSPYEGDDDSGGSVPEVVGGWAERNGCAVDPATSELQPGVEEQRYGGCANDGAVVLLTIEGGVHQWPGTPIARTVADNSAAGRDFDATSAILDFFDSLDQGE
jgi:polyhydroxybutyrate depolymerase